jgi:hypothetical protein
MEFCEIPESEVEIPILDPPARGAVPAEFTTKSTNWLLKIRTIAVVDVKVIYNF